MDRMRCNSCAKSYLTNEPGPDGTLVLKRRCSVDGEYVPLHSDFSDAMNSDDACTAPADKLVEDAEKTLNEIGWRLMKGLEELGGTE